MGILFRDGERARLGRSEWRPRRSHACLRFTWFVRAHAFCSAREFPEPMLTHCPLNRDESSPARQRLGLRQSSAAFGRFKAVEGHRSPRRCRAVGQPGVKWARVRGEARRTAAEGGCPTQLQTDTSHRDHDAGVSQAHFRLF